MPAKYRLHIKPAQVVLILCTLLVVMAQSEDREQEARQILDATGVKGGLIVHVGCGDGLLTAALRSNDRYLVHGLDTDKTKIETARKRIVSKGAYGDVSFMHLTENKLPYVDNLVNLLIIEDPGNISKEEMMRVLAPLGVLFLKENKTWTKVVKSWPKEIDEWTHYLHGPDGNPVAQDRVVGPPKHYQWISGPLWLRSHESDSSVKALVTAGGRLFYINDEAPISLLGDHSLPDKWFLTARDAFNGILLWKIPIEDWGWRAWKPSWFTPRPGDIPLNMPKRLVATEDKVYVTLGYRAPVSEVDARTGEIINTFPGSERTTEILFQSGTLILTVLQDDRARVVALDHQKGQFLWTSENSYGGTVTDYYRFRAMHGSVPPAKVEPTLNTATDGKVIALLDGQEVVCLDFKTGNERWRTPFPLVKADYKAGNINAQQTVWTGTLIVKDGAIIHASPNQMAGFSAQTGTILWTQPKKYLQHLWFEWKDVFVIDSLVWTWSAELERGKLDGAQGISTWPASVNGYDLHTGELKKKVDLGNIFKTYHHHRCYRNKATSRYILASRRGTEYIDLEERKHTIHNWVRGTCHLGMMPANGLQYAPPHPCVCYIDEKINGFVALAPATGKTKQQRRTEKTTILEQGPAYGKTNGPAPSEEDWPEFRCDTLRSGSTKSKVPVQLKQLWRKKLADKLGSPVLVGNQLFVPSVDEYSILCLNGRDGVLQWEYPAGGRIDSPPTYYQGTILFGSADGWVYCVRTTDGQLVWRFHAAPEARLIGAFGRLESAWPVHGSILVKNGLAYIAAGRSSQLDGGIYLYALDAISGQIRYTNHLEGPHYHVNSISQNFQLPMGSLPDILQADDKFIYMRSLIFNSRLEPQKLPPGATTDRVHSKGALLDDSYFKRVPWQFGQQKSYGRLAVHDARSAYFVRMFDSLRGLDPQVYFTPGKQGYLLYAVNRNVNQPTWQKRIPIRGNAMVVTPDRLFVAGYPDIVDPDDPLAAFEGRKGGVLSVYNKADGKEMGQWELSSPPVFHGLAAANERLYLALQDGTVACFGN